MPLRAGAPSSVRHGKYEAPRNVRGSTTRLYTIGTCSGLAVAARPPGRPGWDGPGYASRRLANAAPMTQMTAATAKK